MFENRLFFGLVLTETCKIDLENLPLGVKKLFILNGDPAYLQEIEIKGITYLGKFLSECSEITSLDPISQNIISLLKRLLPHQKYNENELVLLTVFC